MSKGKNRAGTGDASRKWRICAVRLLLACLWAALSLAALPALLALGGGALFGAWNLNAGTVARAPVWARALYAHWAALSSMAGLVAFSAVGLPLARRWGLSRAGGVRARRACALALTPLAVVALSLAADSLRLRNGLASPAFSAAWALLACRDALAALAGGIGFDRLAKGLLAQALPPAAARGLAALAFAGCASLCAGAPPLYWLNMLLLGWLLLRGGDAEFMAGWLGFRWASERLFAPAAGAGLYGLLDVSEDWLTGGPFGVAAGLGVTALLAALAAWEGRNALRRAARRLAPVSRKEPEPASGKRNRRATTGDRKPGRNARRF